MFNVQQENWKIIYINKIKNICDKTICEFNYKLLNNLLCCNLFLHQCKLRPSKWCDYCQDTTRTLNILFLNVTMSKKYVYDFAFRYYVETCNHRLL